MLFIYDSFDKNGKTVKGEIDVPMKKDVVAYLEAKGLTPSKIQLKSSSKNIFGFLGKSISQKVSEIEKIFMTRNMAVAIKAGLSMNEALVIVINDSKPGALKEILTAVKKDVQSGNSFSEALSRYDKHFSPMFVGLLKAGEASGQLDKSFEELSVYMIKEYALARKIKSALMYPAMLLVASFMVVVFILVFILPRLANTFDRSGEELPFITRALLATSQFVTSNFILVFLGLIAVILGFVYGLRSKWGREFYYKVGLHTPVLKDLISRVALVKFTRTLQSLLMGGMPVLKALDISAETVGNDVYKKAILSLSADMKAGVPLSKGMGEHTALFPSLLVSLVGVGEKTGSLEYVLQTFSNFYDDEVENKLKDLTTLFEPVLLLIMGVIVGTIAVSVLLPIYQLVGKYA